MDNSLKVLINTYELEPSDSPVSYKSVSRESYHPQLIVEQASDMVDSFRRNCTQNGRKYVPPHRKPRNEDCIGSGTSHGLKTTEEDKIAKRRERFSRRIETCNQSHDYGLVSRGEDTRLKESEALREEYFLVILHQFIRYTSNNTSHALSETFKRMKDLNPNDFESAQSLQSNEESDKKSVSMESLTMSLRKLRESLLHLKPSPFHKKVFLFSTRISYCCGQYQTYVPSINYLLLHKRALGLSSLEIEEVAVILVLHLTHFNNAPLEAILRYFLHIPNRRDILQIIRCWIRNDYYTWIHTYNLIESFAVKSMMRLGLPTMLNHMIKILSSTYFTMRKSVIENELLPDDVEYDDLIRDYKVNWTVNDGGIVTLRRRQSRKEK